MESYDGTASLELDMVVKSGCVREVTTMKKMVVRQKLVVKCTAVRNGCGIK